MLGLGWLMPMAAKSMPQERLPEKLFGGPVGKFVRSSLTAITGVLYIRVKYNTKSIMENCYNIIVFGVVCCPDL